MIKLDNKKDIVDLVGKTIKKINVNGIQYIVKGVEFFEDLIYITDNYKLLFFWN